MFYKFSFYEAYNLKLNKATKTYPYKNNRFLVEK